MRCGVLTFSYANVGKFNREISGKRLYSVNLGDNMQTLAVRSLYDGMGFADVIDVDRDTLASYAGEPVILPMNGCFYDWCFPLSPRVTPIFIGFQTKSSVIAKHRDFFREHAPIGCRDTATTEAFHAFGIPAETTGCLTLTFPPRKVAPSSPKTLIVFGIGQGQFPAEVLKRVPPKLLENLEFVFQRKIVHEYPLGLLGRHQAEAHARHLLDEYRSRATLVITPLHHAATPALASGIPVVLCRRTIDSRFSYLSELVPIYLPPSFDEIDWHPRAPDLTDVREALYEKFRAMVLSAAQRRGPYEGSRRGSEPVAK